jgi:hypothetical protein
MAKKPVRSGSLNKKKSSPPAKGVASKAIASTPVRNTPVPKIGASVAAKPVTQKREITHADIAKRAYEIWASGRGGSETDNWHRAERELRSGR